MNTQKAIVMSVAALAAVGIGAAAAALTTNRSYPQAEASASTAADSSVSAYTAAATGEASATGGITSEYGMSLYSPDYSETGDDIAAQTKEESTTEKKGFFKKKEMDATTETSLKSNTKGTAKPTAGTTKGSTASDYAYAYAGFHPGIADTGGAWNLLLVNRDYILPDGYEDKIDLVPAISGSDIKLDSRVAPHYQEMYTAAKKDGIILTPVSGYRSFTRQKNNFENKIQEYMNEGYSKVEATQMAAKRILPPGTSEHNAGLAMDICVASVSAHFENSEEYAWLDKHAADYGFILRYAKDKQNITNITYEPWHWRYVGVTAAKAMKASGECLEEYLGY